MSPLLSFKSRVRTWAEKLDAPVASITVRSMPRKWASCSTAGRLTFDNLLLDLPSHLQDFVIVHELLHLCVPNHGRLWKSLMRVHLGNFEAVEAELQAYHRGFGYRSSDFGDRLL